MRKGIKITIDVITYIFLGLVLIYILNVAYFKAFKKEKLPRVFNYYIFNVLTGSMENTIHINDYIIVKRTDKVKVNDIITFEDNGAFITHRIIKIENDKITTKGDANNAADNPISKKQIVGKYIGKAKVLGFIIKYKYIFIAIVVMIYGISYIFDRK